MLWAEIMRDRFGATDERSQMLRFHAQTGGSTLTAQQAENNIVRVAVQAFSAVCGGAQSLHTNGFDEALALPTERSATIALRTQQILATEAGSTQTTDPLGGSYYIEALTDELASRARELIAEIDEMGGAVAAVESGWVQDQIEQAAFTHHQRVQSGDEVIVGVNKWTTESDEAIELQKIDPALRAPPVRAHGAVRASPRLGRGRGGPGRVRVGGGRRRQPAAPDPRGAARLRDDRRGVHGAAPRVGHLRLGPRPLGMHKRCQGTFYALISWRRGSCRAALGRCAGSA